MKDWLYLVVFIVVSAAGMLVTTRPLALAIALFVAMDIYIVVDFSSYNARARRTQAMILATSLLGTAIVWYLGLAPLTTPQYVALAFFYPIGGFAMAYGELMRERAMVLNHQSTLHARPRPH